MERYERKGPDHYKLRMVTEANRVYVARDTWFAFKETPNGYWLLPERWLGWGCRASIDKEKRFITKNGGRQWAYSNWDRALASFKIRCERRLLWIKETQLALDALLNEEAWAKITPENIRGHNTPITEYESEVNWIDY
jgi:hypothetical protein